VKNLVIILFLIPLTSFSQSFKTKVFAVHDGDSYKISLNDSTKVWIRLWGVDAPEVISNYVTKHQPYGLQSSQNLRNLIKGDSVWVDTLYRDQYKRLVCRVTLEDSTDLTEYVVSTGNAWWLNDGSMTKEYLSNLKTLQDDAKDSQIGLWGLSGYKYRPSTWRQKYKRITSKKVFLDLW